MFRLACWGLIVVMALICGNSGRAEEVAEGGLRPGVVERVVPLDLLVAPESPAESPAVREQLSRPPVKRPGRVIVIEEGRVQPPKPKVVDGDGGFRSGGGVAYPVGNLVIPVGPLQEANARRQELIDSLQVLQDAYCRNAQLDEALEVRNMIQQLKLQARQAKQLPAPVIATPPSGPAADIPPVDVRSLRGQIHQTFFVQVTGSVGDYAWGGDDNVYTDDSPLSAAAVHAGVLKAGETGVVRFTVLPGRDSYPGIDRNGIRTRPWQKWDGSYRVDGAVASMNNAYHLRGQGIPPFSVYVVGSLAGTVWGSGSYTDDSDLGTAAVHAGLLKEGQAGFVKVTLDGGRESYEGSTQNGVTTLPYHNWGGGYRLSSSQPERVKLWNNRMTLDVF